MVRSASTSWVATSVVYTSPFGCIATSASDSITGTESNNLWVYPNPNRGVFQVRFFNQSNEPATVQVFSAAGQKVYEEKVITGTQTYSQIQVDLGLKANGVYVVRLVNGSGKVAGIETDHSTGVLKEKIRRSYKAILETGWLFFGRRHAESAGLAEKESRCTKLCELHVLCVRPIGRLW